MKLYYHPVSTTSRPVMLLAADDNIALEYELVDLFTGAHMQTAYGTINPSRQVPVLEDGDFRLTESSAILKYLADKAGSAAYPKDLRERARVNECMDWFNTGLYRDLGYGFIYAQCLPDNKYDDEKVQAATVGRARTKACKWLGILDRDLLGPDHAYLCGAKLTIADYLGVCYLTVGEVVNLSYAAYPNITRWIATMKARPTWAKTNAGFYEYFVKPFSAGSYAGL